MPNETVHILLFQTMVTSFLLPHSFIAQDLNWRTYQELAFQFVGDVAPRLALVAATADPSIIANDSATGANRPGVGTAFHFLNLYATCFVAGV